MTCKEIIKKIKNVEKEYKTAWYINGEHSSTQNKREMLELTLASYNAVLTALYDFIFFYNNDFSMKKVDEHLALFKDDSKSKDLSEKDKTFNEAYEEFFEDLRMLHSKEIQKLNIYIDKLNKRTIKRSSNVLLKKQDEITNEIISIINDLYIKIQNEKKFRKNKIFHVGTTKEEIDDYINEILPEEVELCLYIQAVKDGLNEGCGKVVSISDTEDFNLDKVESLRKSKYFDEFDTKSVEIYRNTFNNIIGLSKTYKAKISKKLNDKLN